MTAVVVSGNQLAGEIENRVAAAVAARKLSPTLAVVLNRDEVGAAAYARSLARAASRVGAEVVTHALAGDTPSCAALIRELNADARVHGIILQKPFAGRDNDLVLAELISPSKDVDGQTSASLGALWMGHPKFVPSTAAAALYILDKYKIPLRGTQAVVVGRSPVVGKPAAALLVARDATVTICHTKTRNLAEACSRADVLVVAAGSPRLVTADMVKAGAAVVDCGYNVLADGAVVGDVAFEEVSGRAALITPAKGGVGPVTTALLLAAVARAAGAEVQL